MGKTSLLLQMQVKKKRNQQHYIHFFMLTYSGNVTFSQHLRTTWIQRNAEQEARSRKMLTQLIFWA